MRVKSFGRNDLRESDGLRPTGVEVHEPSFNLFHRIGVYKKKC